MGIGRRMALGLSAVALCAAGCGSTDDGETAASTPTPAAASAADLGAIKAYLLDHTERLQTDVAAIQDNAEAYYALAEAADFDYQAMLEGDREQVARLVAEGQAAMQKANPAYEEAEGVVAGVPELAEFDVTIDAGSDGSDPASAVAFSLKTPAGKTYKQPGNYFSLIETSIFGTEPKWAAEGVTPDLDGDGKVEFGEALPDADFYVTAARDFEATTKELDAAARKWDPTLEDALTALVVMTPTMSEYFEAWKNSRFVAGSKATETGFVGASRLQDIEDILSGLVLVYDNVEPSIAEVDADQAKQTGRSLTQLRDFAARLRKEEAGGKRFDASDADTLGGEAQSQAEAIAGQISQAAGRLDIELEN